MALEPSLWGTLPKENLYLVFARLPLAGIGQLRVLSKEWKKNVDSKDSEFNHVFHATIHFNMFALLHFKFFSWELWPCNIYDLQENKWHVHEMDAVFDKVETFDGVDGGLVCFVSERRWFYNKPGFFIVMNPLTKQKKQLPPLLSMGVEKSNTQVTMVRMVKLIMDKKTKEYKVFVVGCIENGSQGFFAQVYDSYTKEWTFVEATHGYIIGWDYRNSFYYHFSFLPSLCMYNCANGTLQQFNEIDFASGLKVEPGCCVLLEDHLSVLHKEASPKASPSRSNLLEDGASMLSKYCISEFHLPEKTTTWVKLGVHSCGPCKFDSRHSILNLRLWGCIGFLLVYDTHSRRAWLYNLSTCVWRNLPAFGRCVYPKMMCTISWCAIA